MWGFAAYITATNYLQAQKIVRPQVVTSAIVLALHAPINLLLIYTFGKQNPYATSSLQHVTGVAEVALHHHQFFYLGTSMQLSCDGCC